VARRGSDRADCTILGGSGQLSDQNSDERSADGSLNDVAWEPCVVQIGATFGLYGVKVSQPRATKKATKIMAVCSYVQGLDALK